MTKIEKAVTWALAIANDNTHGYDQQYRWGPDYDCSSLIISAWQQVYWKWQNCSRKNQ